MNNQYLLSIFISVAVLNLSSCGISASTLDYHEKSIPKNIEAGNCELLERNIRVISVDKETQFYKRNKDKVQKYKNDCAMVVAMKRIEKYKIEGRLISENRARNWAYIKDRAIIPKNINLVQVGNGVCTKLSLFSNQFIGKGAITNVNGNNFEVTYYSIHHVQMRNLIGFEPGAFYTNGELPQTKWYPLDEDDYLFYTCK
jgi:hypothetical protein